MTFLVRLAGGDSSVFDETEGVSRVFDGEEAGTEVSSSPAMPPNASCPWLASHWPGAVNTGEVGQEQG